MAEETGAEVARGLGGGTQPEGEAPSSETAGEGHAASRPGAEEPPASPDPNAVLPLGSIVVLRGASRPCMLIARCLKLKTPEGEALVDYGACAWPEGLMGDQVVYFDAPDIERVLALGHVDEHERAAARRIAQATATSELPRLSDIRGGERA